MTNLSIKDNNPDFYDNDVVKKFELTGEIIKKAQEIIDSDKDTISEFWKEKYLNESTKNWDKFYKRNNVNFFLDRHWIDKEFKELISEREKKCIDNDNLSASLNEDVKILIEFGCGVGNSIIPLLQLSDSLHCIGFDCSNRAISLLNERWNKILNSSENLTSYLCNEKDKCPFKNSTKIEHGCNRLKTFTLDIIKEDISPYICENNFADFGLLVFVLSAIHPKHHQSIIKRCSQVLKSGAIILFRDYGRYDMAQLRFAKSSRSKITENFYVRYDGTFAYYFTTEEVEELFCNSGFKTISNNYCLREVVNRKTQISMRRVWVQSKFIKI